MRPNNIFFIKTNSGWMWPVDSSLLAPDEEDYRLPKSLLFPFLPSYLASPTPTKILIMD